MSIVKKIGTSILCGVIVIGFIIVSMTTVSYGLRMRGVNNSVVGWFTQNASVSLVWTRHLKGITADYEREKTFTEKYQEVCYGATATIENFCTGAFPENEEITGASNLYKRRILHNKLDAAVGGKTNTEYLSDAAEGIEFLNDYCMANGINFLYVNVPGKNRIVVATGEKEYVKEEFELKDSFSDYLDAADFLSVNLVANQDIMGHVKADYTVHWMPENALDSTRLIAQALNENYGFAFDLNLFDKSNYYDGLDGMEYLRKGIEETYGYRFEIPVPVNQGMYQLVISDTEQYEGEYTETLLNNEDCWAVDGASYHNTFRIGKAAYTKITNLSENNNSDRRILILGDSFSTPISSYLVQGVGELAAFNPLEFTGDVDVFIENYQPDTIIVIYIDEKIGADSKNAFTKLQFK